MFCTNHIEIQNRTDYKGASTRRGMCDQCDTKDDKLRHIEVLWNDFSTSDVRTSTYEATFLCTPSYDAFHASLNDQETGMIMKATAVYMTGREEVWEDSTEYFVGSFSSIMYKYNQS